MSKPRLVSEGFIREFEKSAQEAKRAQERIRWIVTLVLVAFAIWLMVRG